MAVNTFDLPDLGEGLTEAEVLRWLVAEGDEVSLDQPIVEVETAKSVVEVPSLHSGTVATLHAAAGETLTVGSPLISLEDGTDSGGGEAARTGSGNVLIGYGTKDSGGTRRRRRRQSVPDSHGESDQDAPRTAEAPRVISPLVRQLARQEGVDLHQLTGTGPHGLIMRRDVLAAREEPPAAQDRQQQDEGHQDQGQSGERAASSSSPAQDARTGLGVLERLPVKGVRKAIGEAMVRSRTEIPEATVWVDVDATELLALRAHLKAKDPEGAPSLLALLARFTLAGLTRYPQLCSRIEGEPNAQEIVRFDGVNLGVAVESERGLMVPSVRGADRMSTAQLHEALRTAIETARSGTASPAQLSGSTFTLNNYGVFGTDGATPIINHPDAAILGIGRIIDRPWVVEGELAVRKVTTLTLAFDHRVCDGGAAGGFLRFVADAVEDPTSAFIAL